ncbi:MAG: M10 family metallopeptidase [Pirellulaceae bacterium]
MAQPIVTPITKFIYLNQSIAATDMFTVVDPDGDAITVYRFADLLSSFASGFFRLNGVPYANGSDFTVSASQVSDLEFVAGNQVGQEKIQIAARDASGYGKTAEVQLYFVRDNTLSAPVISTSSTYLLLENESVLLSELISGYDPDGWLLQTYYIKDQSFGTYSGRLSNDVDGQLGQAVGHFLSANKFASTVYTAYNGTERERLYSYIYDGARWSTVGTVDIQSRPNTSRPVAHYNRVSRIEGLTQFIGDELFTWFDGDGNTLKEMQVWDTNSHGSSGRLKLGNQILPAKQWITVSAEDLAALQYVSPTGAYNELFRFRVFDGKYWSAINDVEIDTLERPRIGFDQLVAEEDFKTFRFVSQLLTKLDDGPAWTTLQFYEAPGRPFDSARASIAGNILQPGQVYTLNQTQLNQLVIDSGIYGFREFDTFTFRVSNGTVWSEWNKMEFRTEPVFDTALRSPNGSPNNGFNDWDDWGQSPVVTYSFMQDWTDHDSADGAAADQFAPFSADQREAAREIFRYVSEIINVDFVEVSDLSSNPGGRGGIIRMGNYNNPPPDVGSGEAEAYAFFPADVVENPEGGDMWFNLGMPGISYTGSGWNRFGHEYFVFLHELGHALGMPHSFGIPGGVFPPQTENTRYSVMSYSSIIPDPGSYMLYDIYALHDLYGARMTTRTGDDLYSISTFLGGNASGYSTIWDAGGTDTLSGEGSARAVEIDLREGSYSSIGLVDENVGIAFGALIENATGSNFDDTLTGNHLDNVMVGGLGNDNIWGNSGDDTMTGGVGNDFFRYRVGDGNDTINEQRLAGRDRVIFEAFPTLESLADLSFHREHRDLIINLDFGNELSEGSIRIKDQRWGASRVETLTLQLSGGNVNVDLTSVYDQTTELSKKFTTTGSSSAFGMLVAPA